MLQIWKFECGAKQFSDLDVQSSNDLKILQGIRTVEWSESVLLLVRCFIRRKLRILMICILEKKIIIARFARLDLFQFFEKF